MINATFPGGSEPQLYNAERTRLEPVGAISDRPCGTVLRFPMGFGEIVMRRRDTSLPYRAHPFVGGVEGDASTVCETEVRAEPCGTPFLYCGKLFRCERFVDKV